MPSELFGAVTLRPSSSGRRRRSPVLVVSVLIHLAVFIALVVAQLTDAIALPVPTRTLAFVDPDRIVKLDVVPPPPKPQSPPRADTVVPAVDANAAPIVEPKTIAPETGNEGRPGAAPKGAVVDGGAVQGVPDGFGRVEQVGPPPKAPSAPPAPVRLHSGIRAPTKLVHVSPVYPPMARSGHVEGLVIIEATIDADGSVTAARVLKSVPLLDQAALDAVRQWKFTPTLLNGTAVPVIMTVTVNFRLDQ